MKQLELVCVGHPSSCQLATFSVVTGALMQSPQAPSSSHELFEVHVLQLLVPQSVCEWCVCALSNG